MSVTFQQLYKNKNVKMGRDGEVKQIQQNVNT